jgi:ribulose-bisphosphate carboxylase small chain
MSMRITQGAFSFLEDFTDEQIAAQLRYALRNGWSILVEHTDDPHPRNSLWEIWGEPLFELRESEAAVAMRAVEDARAAFPDDYVKVVCYDRSLGRQTTALSFIVQRPAQEPGFRLERTEGVDRRVQYTLHRA